MVLHIQGFHRLPELPWHCQVIWGILKWRMLLLDDTTKFALISMINTIKTWGDAQIIIPQTIFLPFFFLNSLVSQVQWIGAKGTSVTYCGQLNDKPRISGMICMTLLPQDVIIVINLYSFKWEYRLMYDSVSMHVRHECKTKNPFTGPEHQFPEDQGRN